MQLQEIMQQLEQVGKTTLVKEFSKVISKEAVYLDLERPSDMEKLREPELFLGELTDKCVILDEVQRLPEIFPLLRSIEITKPWLDNFIRTYLERDLPLLGLNASPVVTRRLWEMLAWQNARLLNYSTLSKSLGISNQTTNKYIDFLEGAFLVTRLQPFYFNIKKRLVKSPKILLRDTGILHRLLRLESFDQLMGNPLLGASWEAYAIEQIRSLKNDAIDLYFYRTHAGAKVDLVLVKGLQAVSCIEIKFTSTPNMSKGLGNCIADFGTTKNYIITPKSDDYPVRRDVRVCRLGRFLEKYLGDF